MLAPVGYAGADGGVMILLGHVATRAQPDRATASHDWIAKKGRQAPMCDPDGGFPPELWTLRPAVDTDPACESCRVKRELRHAAMAATQCIRTVRK